MRVSRVAIALGGVWLLMWLALWSAYSWEPLRSFISVENISEVSRPFARHPIAPVIIAGAYLCSVFVVFPRAILTIPAVIVFGPWLTFFGGMLGLIVGALCGFWIGRKLTGPKVQNLTTTPILCRLEEKLRGGGVGGVLLARLVPVAPFTVVNMFFGMLRIATGHFVVGTFLGLLPGFSFSIFIGDRLRDMLHQGPGNLFLLALQLIGAGLVLFLLWRMASAKLKEQER
jgi:phospholipase D1/2